MFFLFEEGVPHAMPPHERGTKVHQTWTRMGTILLQPLKAWLKQTHILAETYFGFPFVKMQTAAASLTINKLIDNIFI